MEKEPDQKKNIKVGPLLSFGYFRAAQLAVDHLIAQKNIGKVDVSKINSISGYLVPFDFENGALLLAARYNFKHALEVSMKSLFLIGDKGVPSGHNISDIAEKMRKELLGHSISEKSYKAWKWLIEEYSIKDRFIKNDTQNELDRYMFSKGGSMFPYKEIHKINRGDLRRFLENIKTAKNLYYKMMSEYDRIKYCQKFDLDIERDIGSKIIICKRSDGTYFTRRKFGVRKSRVLDE